jgi:hypothetical protein
MNGINNMTENIQQMVTNLHRPAARIQTAQYLLPPRMAHPRPAWHPDAVRPGLPQSALPQLPSHAIQTKSNITIYPSGTSETNFSQYVTKHPVAGYMFEKVKDTMDWEMMFNGFEVGDDRIKIAVTDAIGAYNAKNGGNLPVGE